MCGRKAEIPKNEKRPWKHGILAHVKQQAILVDIDGVLRNGNELIDGASDFITHLQKNNLPACLLSNSTKFSSSSVRDFFKSKGIEVELPIITAVDVTADLIKSKYKTASIYCVPSAKEDLSVVPDTEEPEAVVIGDMADGWSYDLLNDMFNKVVKGAQLIAMQKNKFGKASKGLYLDAGAFITALEYASGIESTLVGKPAKTYFDCAISKVLDLHPTITTESFLMIGDDLMVDIQGAQKCGGTGYLMLTGKTSKELLENTDEIKPDKVCDHLTQLLPFLSTENP